MMKKYIIILLLSLFIINLFPSTIFANTDFINDQLPNAPSGGIAKEYNKYPYWNYSLDMDLGWTDPIDTVINFLLNLLFLIYILMVRVSIVILEQAYTLDLLKYVVGYVDDIVNAIKGVVWDEWSVIFLAITGIYILIQHGISANKTSSWQQFFITFIIFIISLTFFAFPSEILSGFNDVSKEASGSILRSVMPLYANQASTVEESITISANQIWINQVKNPWYLMQFGSINDGKLKESKFLPYAPSDEVREDNVEKEAENNFLMKSSLESHLARVFLLTMTLIVGLIFSIVYIIIGGLIFISQFVPVLLISFAALVLLVSLTPGFGLRIIEKWIQRMIYLSFFKVILSILLSVMLVLSALLYRIFGNQMLWALIVQALLIIAMSFEYQRILGLFTSIPKGADAVAHYAEKADYGKQMLYAGNQAVRGYTGALETFGYGTSYSQNPIIRAMRARKDYKENKQLRDLSPIGEKYLQHQYVSQKEEAEKIAFETGKEPHYNDFVKQVDENIDRGLPLFTSKQINDATNSLMDINKQGGDIKRVLNPLQPKAKNSQEYLENTEKHKQIILDKQRALEKRKNNRKQLINASENSGEFYSSENILPNVSELSPIQKNFKDSTSELKKANTQNFVPTNPIQETEIVNVEEKNEAGTPSQDIIKNRQEQAKQIRRRKIESDPVVLSPLQQSFKQSTDELKRINSYVPTSDNQLAISGEKRNKKSENKVIPEEVFQNEIAATKEQVSIPQQNIVAEKSENNTRLIRKSQQDEANTKKPSLKTDKKNQEDKVLDRKNKAKELLERKKDE